VRRPAALGRFSVPLEAYAAESFSEGAAFVGLPGVDRRRNPVGFIKKNSSPHEAVPTESALAVDRPGMG
jgi:hypothetical protein